MTLECIELRLDQNSLCDYLSKLDRAGVPYGFTVNITPNSREITLHMYVDDTTPGLEIRLQDGRWYATVQHPVIEMVPATKKENQHADA